MYGGATRHGVVDGGPGIEQVPQVADKAGQDHRPGPEVDPREVLGRVVDRLARAEKARDHDGEQAEDAERTADQTRPRRGANACEPAHPAARICDGFLPDLVSREKHDQDEGDDDHAGTGVEVEGKRDRQVVTLSEGVKQDSREAHGLTTSVPRGVLVLSHSMSQVQVLSALKVCETVVPATALNGMS